MSFYVLAVDDVIQKYPYTLTDMRRDNPDIGFAPLITDDVAAKHNTFPVKDTPQPSFDAETQYLVRAMPDDVSGKWHERWEVKTYTPDEIAERHNEWRHTATCSPFQGKAALFNAGLLDKVETLISATETSTIVKLAWANASEWRRSSTMIASLASALSMTDEQVDDLFKAAAQISA